MHRSSRLACGVLLTIAAAVGTSLQAQGQELVKSKDGSGVVGYKDTPLLPWTHNKYHKHDPDRPQSPVVVPGRPSTQERVGTAPSDAIVLFDGTDLSHWKPNEWKL